MKTALNQILIFVICSLPVSCYNTKYLQEFNLTGLIPGQTIIPEKDIEPKTVTFNGNIYFYPYNNPGYNNGQHSRVNLNGAFVIDTNNISKNNSLFDVEVDSVDLVDFKGNNIVWNTSPVSFCIGFDWRNSKLFSFGSQFSVSAVAEQILFSFVLGPSLHYHIDGVGGRITFNLGLMNFNYKMAYLTEEYRVGDYAFLPEGDFWLIVEEEHTLSPFFSTNFTLNTMREFLLMKYYINIGYERFRFYVQRELVGDDLKVRFSFITLQLGIFKETGKWTLVAGGGVKYENRWNIDLGELLESYKENTAEKPLIPVLTVTLHYSLSTQK